MKLSSLIKHAENLSVFKVVAPQDGGWSLVPMENLLRGLRNGHDAIALELYGADGVVGYTLRSKNGDGMGGVLHAHFPQARVDRKTYGVGEEFDSKDWLHLDEAEFAIVQPLSLLRES